MIERRIVRFGLAGLANTAFSLLTYAGAIHLGLATWLALLVALFAGLAFNFVSMGGYAFRDLSVQRLPRFVGCYAVTYLINLGGLHLLVASGIGPIAAQLMVTPPVAAFSYFALSRFVFRQ